MALNYPYKSKVINKVNNTKQVDTNKEKKEKKINIKKANLGMDLEDALNQTNEYYLANNIAIIHKKPTPVQIVKVDYPMRSKAVITEAYYKTPSTTDYNGIYRGKYIDFEAKESHNKTSFPLANIHEHQIIHLNNIINHGGIGFLIIYFTHTNEYFYTPFEVVKKYWDNKEMSRKSIPYQVFKDECYLIKEAYLPRINYLKIVDELYFNK